MHSCVYVIVGQLVEKRKKQKTHNNKVLRIKNNSMCDKVCEFSFSIFFNFFNFFAIFQFNFFVFSFACYCFVNVFLPNKLAKTITKHVPRYTSMDLTYEIFGRAALVDDISVVIVSTVVTPSATRAGVALRLSQNDTHDIITISPDGI